MIVATVKPGQDLNKAETIIDEELARLIASGPTADELERARTGYLASFVRGLDRVGGFGGKSDILASGQVFHGDPAEYKIRTKLIQSATAAEVQAAAKQWLSDGVFVLEVVPFPTFTSSGQNRLIGRSCRKFPQPEKANCQSCSARLFQTD